MRQRVGAGVVDGVRGASPGDSAAQRAGRGRGRPGHEPRLHGRPAGHTGGVRQSTDRAHDAAAGGRQRRDRCRLAGRPKTRLLRQVFPRRCSSLLFYLRQRGLVCLSVCSFV